MVIKKINVREEGGYKFVLGYIDTNGQEYAASAIYKRIRMQLNDVHGFELMVISYGDYNYPMLGIQGTPLICTDIPKHIVTDEEFEKRYSESIQIEMEYFNQLVQLGQIPIFGYEIMMNVFPNIVHLSYLDELEQVPAEQARQYESSNPNADYTILGYNANITSPTSIERVTESDIKSLNWDSKDVHDVYKEITSPVLNREDMEKKLASEPKHIWSLDEIYAYSEDLIVKGKEELFPYDRSAACLQIPRSVEPPIQACHACLSNSLERLGVPYDFNEIDKTIKELRGQQNAIIQENLKLVGNKVPIIEYTKRSEVYNHYLVLFHEMLYGEDANYRLNEYRTKSKQLSADKNVRQGIIDALTRTVNSHILPPPAQELHEKSLQFITNAHQILSLGSAISNLESINDFKNVATADEKESHIRFVHPNLEMGNTFRYSTNSPAIQNQTALTRGMICAPDGWEISAIDVTAQDMMMVVQGVLENPIIKQEMFKEANPYKAVCVGAGYEFTPEMKNAIKKPTLSLFNGQAERVVYQEVGPQYHDLASAIIKLIKADPGYKKHQAKCREIAQLTIPYRMGQFGSAIVISDADESRRNNMSYHLYNQILNGPAQITSLEVLSVSVYCLFMDLYLNKCAIPKINYSTFKPLVTIHDEIIVMNRLDVHDEAAECLRWYMLPQVEGWARLAGEVTQGKYYIHK